MINEPHLSPILFLFSSRNHTTCVWHWRSVFFFVYISLSRLWHIIECLPHGRQRLDRIVGRIRQLFLISIWSSVWAPPWEISAILRNLQKSRRPFPLNSLSSVFDNLKQGCRCRHIIRGGKKTNQNRWCALNRKISQAFRQIPGSLYLMNFLKQVKGRSPFASWFFLFVVFVWL